MASTLPSADNCCDTCDEPVSVAVPGPAGDDGADGADGADGLNAYTTTTASFNMPAEGANTVPDVAVVSSAWASVGQIVFVKAGGAVGYFEVIAKPTATTLTLKNLEDAGTGAYTGNSVATTAFTSSATISPAGLQGPGGASSGMAPVGATYITQTPDGTLTNEQALSALATGLVKNTTATGVLTIATQGNANTNVPFVDDASGLTNGESLFATATGVESKTAAAARTALGVAIGSNVQAQDAFLTSIAALGTAANKFIFTTGVDTASEGDITSFARSVLDDSSAAIAQQTLHLYATNEGRLGDVAGIDYNVVADNGFVINAPAGKYIIDKILLFYANDSVGGDRSMTTAQVAVYTGAGATGTLIAAAQGITALTTTTKWIELTLETIVTTDVFTAPVLYLRVTTPQGAVSNGLFSVCGRNLSV